MNLRRGLLVSVLALAAPVVATSGPSAAAAEQCLGRPATHVGPGAGGVVTGSPGDDVILTAGATEVDALGGDDTICVSGTDTDASIDAGSGDDVVSANSHDEPVAPRGTARVGTARVADPVVTIALGGGEDVGLFGNDGSWPGGFNEPDAGAVADFVLDGGPDRDRIELDAWWVADKDEELDGDVHVDVAAGTASMMGDVAIDFSAVEEFVADAQGTATLLGSTGRDHLTAYGCGGTIVKGGPGRDFVEIHRPISDDDELWCSATRPGAADKLWGGAGADTVRALMAAELLGGSGADVLDARPSCARLYIWHDSCGVVLRGEDGNDTVYGGPGHRGANPDTLEGGAGNDLLYGLGGPDRIYGGSGRDHAYGGTGQDLCRAERRTGCER